MRRLSVIDGIFLRTHRGMGTPIALQGVWRTADTVDPARLSRFAEALRAGPLGRRVRPVRVPGARARWQPNDRVHRIERRCVPLSPADILPWADRQGADLDPRSGPGWRLATAPLTDGGTVVALTCSHALTDARGLIIAADRALRAQYTGGGPVAELAGTETDAARSPGDDPDSDWADAAAIWATVLAGTVRAVRNSIPPAARAFRRAARAPDVGRWLPRLGPRSAGGERQARPGARPVGAAAGPAATDPRRPGRAHESSPAPRASAGPHEASFSAGRTSPPTGRALPSGGSTSPVAGTALPVAGTVLRSRAGDWERVAAGSGGTANSLFIWLVANTLWAAGFPDRPIAASLPVDTRHDDRVDNDLAMTEITVAPTDGPADIRVRSRAAYERRMSSPAGLPEEFLHLVPGRVAYRLSGGAGERDILCSNIGPIPPMLHALGPHDCTGVAARAIHPGLTYARRPRTRVSGYLCRFRGDYLLTLSSLIPEWVAGAAELRQLAVGTGERVGLALREW